jgi:hypothetical protein
LRKSAGGYWTYPLFFAPFSSPFLRRYDYGTSTDVDRIKYGYDRNGNRAYRENTVATAAGANFDGKYLHDLIDRLKHMERGALDDLKSQIQDPQFAERWGLDATGNWRSFLEDSDGNGTWDLEGAFDVEV